MPIISVEEKWPDFEVTGVKPDALEPFDAFEPITQDSFPGQWKIFVFYPKDFTFVCPTEIVGFDALREEFEQRNAVVLMGSTDNEYCKVNWKMNHPELKNIKTWMFADAGKGGQPPLCHQIGAFDYSQGAARRGVFIVDDGGWVQYSAVHTELVGRSPEEVLRVLDALQTGEMCACNRPIGGDTL